MYQHQRVRNLARDTVVHRGAEGTIIEAPTSFGAIVAWDGYDLRDVYEAGWQPFWRLDDLEPVNGLEGEVKK